ncbi:hypothetical protein F5B21DRAFT_497697, partial [Xylaria acuta]
MRVIALNIIRKAWRDYVLVPEEHSIGKKRKRDLLHEGQTKQNKLNKSDQIVDLTTLPKAII